MKYAIIPIFFLFVFSCKNERQQAATQPVAHNTDSTRYSEGRIVCSALVTSNDSNDIETFYEFNPHKTELFYKGDKFRYIEHGGLSKGNIILDKRNLFVYQLDTLDKIAYSGEFSDLSVTNDKVKELMPDYYAPTVAETGETEEILGLHCKKLKVLRSGYVRADTETFIWVTDSIVFPPARYDVTTADNRVITPVPFLIGYPNGTVMRLTYTADSMRVTYEITEMQQVQLPDSLFTLPPDYEVR